MPTDTEMLDWIIEKHAKLHYAGGSRGVWFVDWPTSPIATTLFDDPREAIAAAMKAGE